MASTAGVTWGATTSTTAPAASSPGSRRCATEPPPTTTARRPARSRPARYGSGMRVSVSVSVSVRRVLGVVVRGLRSAELVFEAGEEHPVGAGVAVHPDVACERLVVPLDDEVRERIGVPEVARDHDVHVGVRGAER